MIYDIQSRFGLFSQIVICISMSLSVSVNPLSVNPLIKLYITPVVEKLQTQELENKIQDIEIQDSENELSPHSLFPLGLLQSWHRLLSRWGGVWDPIRQPYSHLHGSSHRRRVRRPRRGPVCRRLYPFRTRCDKPKIWTKTNPIFFRYQICQIPNLILFYTKFDSMPNPI